MSVKLVAARKQHHGPNVGLRHFGVAGQYRHHTSRNKWNQTCIAHKNGGCLGREYAFPDPKKPLPVRSEKFPVPVGRELDKIRVQNHRDAEVWVASTNDIDGLAVETATLEELEPKVVGAISDLIELNSIRFDTAGIPVHVLAERLARIPNPRH